MDYREFASKVKAKHPEYSDMDDRDLAQKMVAKFPHQYSDVSFDAQPLVEEAAVPPPAQSLLDRAADTSLKVQDAVLGPISRASDAAARGYSKLAFGTDIPVDIAQAGLAKIDEGFRKGGEWIAEKGGELGYPKTGVALGLAAQMAPYAIPVGPETKISTALEPFAGKPGVAARIKQMRTGVEASSFERLRRDPTAFFKMTSREDAGQAVGAAKQAAGIDLGVTNDIRSLTQDNIAKARNPMSASNKAQDVIAEKLSAASEANPEATSQELIRQAGITPSEAASALDGINKRLAKLERSEGHGSPSFQKWSAIKSHVQSVLEEVAPEVKSANKEFSRVALRDQFMEPMPVNQSGTISKISNFAFVPAGAGVGAMATGFNPLGAIAGAAAVQAARSPFVAGLGTATRGLIDKLIDPALSKGATSLTNRPFLLEYMRRRGEVRK